MWTCHRVLRQHFVHVAHREGTVSSGADEAYSDQIFLAEEASGHGRCVSSPPGDEVNVREPSDEAAAGSPIQIGERRYNRMGRGQSSLGLYML